MQIATKPFIVCVLATAIATLSSRGADTEAQIKAREALRQKMSELSAQPVTNATAAPAVPSKAPESQPVPAAKPTPEPAAATPTPTPTPAETVKPVPPPAATHTVIEAPPTRTAPPGQPQAPAPVVKTTRQPKPKPAPVAKTPKTVPAPSGQVTASRPDSEKVAKARQALEEKMRELDAQGGQPAIASQPTVTQPPVETQPVSRPVVVSQPPPAATQGTFHTPEIRATSQPAVAAAASDANEPLPTPPPVTKPGQASQTKPQSKPQTPKRPTQTAQVPEPRQRYALPEGPPPPVSADKVQKLDTLLQQYRADRITPEQYQQERAKILAGP